MVLATTRRSNLYERVMKRIAVNRDRALPALHQNELVAARCTSARFCLLLLTAGLFDDLSDGLFGRLSDRPSDPASDVLSRL